MSVDALRGFDMFWIVGADSFMTALGQMSANPVLRSVSRQLEHKAWAGFTFYDLIFPLFVFLVGVSIVFSLTKTLAQEGRGAAHRRILRRAALLYVVALFYSGGVTHPWPDIRLLGVLNRIALCYGVAALIFCHFRWRGVAAIGAGL
ncbi:MAG TPA: DUF5009 domain-containing protein, partial [Methylomirabilota bacterium]|nr:DUF5009 domain-containing protein [Methylomirabilota bacterium]